MKLKKLKARKKTKKRGGLLKKKNLILILIILIVIIYLSTSNHTNNNSQNNFSKTNLTTNHPLEEKNLKTKNQEKTINNQELTKKIINKKIISLALKEGFITKLKDETIILINKTPLNNTGNYFSGTAYLIINNPETALMKIRFEIQNNEIINYTINEIPSITLKSCESMGGWVENEQQACKKSEILTILKGFVETSFCCSNKKAYLQLTLSNKTLNKTENSIIIFSREKIYSPEKTVLSIKTSNIGEKTLIPLTSGNYYLLLKKGSLINCFGRKECPSIKLKEGINKIKIG